MLVLADAKSSSLFPKKELLRSGEEGVSQVQFERFTIGIAVGDGVDDVVTGHLIGPMLNEVAKHQGFVVGQVPLVEVGLDATGDFLKTKLVCSTLNQFEMFAGPA